MKKLLLIVTLVAAAASVQGQGHTFTMSGDNFLLDGKPFQIISGEMHFARIPREYWRERLKMAKAMGLNTIATYVFWNYQEPEKGRYNFKGNADVAEFVREAQEEGLWVLLRPSAYACAEWESGGYPYWLFKERKLKVRSRDPEFLKMVNEYFGQLGKQLAPLQVTRGGPIIMVQIENEYGSYGDDKEYLNMNVRMMHDVGFDVPFYTCDGADLVSRGCVGGVLPAVNGLDDVVQVADVVRKNNNGHGPFFIAEWYPGWFDSWGKPHHTVLAEEFTARLDTILAHGYSINIYMEHGGTTRGFMNGANMDDSNPYSPQTSSYDYDAPIDEAGNPTHKFYVFRDAIRQYLPAGVTLPDVPPRNKTIAVPKFKLKYADDLTHLLPKPVLSRKPLTFEDVSQAYGYVLYRTRVKGPMKGTLDIVHLRDYGIVFVNGKRAAVLDRRLGQETCGVEFPSGENTLDIFMENLGRINYGKYINDNHKGITDSVLLDGKQIEGWKIYGFPMKGEPVLDSRRENNSDYPIVRHGYFDLSDTGDTFLDMRDFGKGVAWINGHNLGRYWNIGPQQTIYVPAPWLRKGKNTIAVFEELKPEQDEIGSLETPILDDLREK
jgi:beta-galactosidase